MENFDSLCPTGRELGGGSFLSEVLDSFGVLSLGVFKSTALNTETREKKRCAPESFC